jgi:uncharacterized SAM-binding protein YcdF (DUF218 family)
MTYLQPFTFLFLSLAALGLCGLRHHWRTASWRTAFCGLLGLVALTWPPAAEILAKPLTSRYAKQIRPINDAEVIVVLAGVVNDPTEQRPYTLVGRDTYRRVMHAAWLFHNSKPVPILATGGSQSRTGEAASIVMRRMLEAEGVPSSKVWTEEQSKTTYENALYSARLLHEHGVHQVALVVEADSMLRAEMCFRKQGFGVTPAPCLFRDYSLGGATELLPGWQGIYRQEILLHEGIGLFWYWIRGRI